MNTALFENTSLADLMGMVLGEGTIIGNREEAQFRIRLYKIGESFAELWYDPRKIKIDKIEEVSSDWVRENYPEVSS